MGCGVSNRSGGVSDRSGIDGVEEFQGASGDCTVTDRSSMPKPEPEPEPEPELRRPVSPRPQQPLVEPEAAGATLWVGNIPDSLLQGSDGLKKTEAELRRVFFAHGVTTAVSVRKKPEGANKSWAFVSFATADGVQKAVMCSNFIACADGSRAELTVKVADIQAQIKKRASTPDSDRPPAGAMESMWNAQNKQVLQGLRTPMQEILETLHDIAATVPSVAAKIDQVTATLTSTEDLWSTEGSGDGKAVGSGSFKEVVDEDVKSYLLSHSNQQLHESNAYSQELMRRRYKESKARRGRTRKGPKKTLSSKAKSVDLVDDFAAKLVRVVPEIGDEARIELGQWEKKIDHWDFDIFRVNELTNGSPLAFVLYAVFSRYDLLNKLQLEERAVISLAHALDAGYTQQSVAPYHNNIHGADVIQALCYFIQAHLHERLVDTEILAAVLAAAVHDIAHPAVTNHFHVETFSPMAMLYNDQSVNENHHLSSGFAILQKPEHDLLAKMSRADRKDLANHFDYIARLNTKLDSAEVIAVNSPRAGSSAASAGAALSKTLSSTSSASSVVSNGDGGDASASSPSPVPAPDSSPSATMEPLLLMETAMKMSDVANGARMPKVYDEWSARVFSEFYLQGDQEAKAGLPISSFMDRSNPKELQCQSSFLQYIVGPLYAVGKRIWPDLSAPTTQLDANKQALEEKATAAAPALSGDAASSS